MKKILVMAMAAVMAAFAGCGWLKTITQDIDANTYVQYAGKAIAKIISLSTDGKYIKAEDKDVFVKTLDAVVATLPKDTKLESLNAAITQIVDAKLIEAIPDETKRKLVRDTTTYTFTVVSTLLEKAAEKYPYEFKNADTAYQLIINFLTSMRAEFMPTTAAKAPASQEPNKKFEAVYKEVQTIVSGFVPVKK